MAHLERSERYEFQRVLGRGSFGVATLVRERNSRTFLVAKELFMGTSATPKARRVAENEVEVLKSLKHANIVAYVDSVVDERTFCILMEYADGGDLSAAIARQRPLKHRFREEEVFSVLLQAARALQYIHHRHIVHRDVKSQNVFLTRAGEVKLGDFGVAIVLDTKSDLALTAIGTPSHLAPEVCHGEAYGTKADMWSFGVVMFEVMALEMPFQAANILALVSRITSAEPKDVSSGPYQSTLWALVRKLLQKAPEDRPTAPAVLASSVVKLFCTPGAEARGTAALAAVAAGGIKLTGEAFAFAAHKPLHEAVQAHRQAQGRPEETRDSLEILLVSATCSSTGDSSISEALRRELNLPHGEATLVPHVEATLAPNGEATLVPGPELVEELLGGVATGLPEERTPGWARHRRSVPKPPELLAVSSQNSDSLDELLKSICGTPTTVPDIPTSLSSRSSAASRPGARSRASSFTGSRQQIGGVMMCESTSTSQLRVERRSESKEAADGRAESKEAAKPRPMLLGRLEEPSGKPPSKDGTRTPTLSVQGFALGVAMGLLSGLPSSRDGELAAQDYPRLFGRRRSSSGISERLLRAVDPIKAEAAPSQPVRPRVQRLCTVG